MENSVDLSKLLNVKTIFSDSFTQRDFDELLNFCRKAEKEEKHAAAVNMGTEGWESRINTLLYVFAIEKRFPRSAGGLDLVYIKDELIGVSGFYRSDFSKDIFIIGVRSWIKKEYRFSFILTKASYASQTLRAQAMGAKMVAFTYNEDTRPFAAYVDRCNRDPEQHKRAPWGEAIPDFYRNMTYNEMPLKIRETKQWVLYKKLDPAFIFDWSQIQWNG